MEIVRIQYRTQDLHCSLLSFVRFGQIEGMSDICKFVKMKNLSVFLSASMLVINCLSTCLSVGLSVCFFVYLSVCPCLLSYLSAFVYSWSVICESIDRSVCTVV